MTFQVGLAVDDIKDVLNTAEVEKLKSKVTPKIYYCSAIAIIIILFTD